MYIQALRLNAELRGILEDCGCGQKTLLLKAMQVEPDLKFSRRNMKRYLWPSLRGERKLAAWRGYQSKASFYTTLIYADEATIYPLPEAGNCWTKEGDHPVEEDSRYKALNFGLHIFLAVHPHIGLLHYQLLSRNKGDFEGKEQYEVSQLVTIEGRS
jgi:hypothetical protein